MDKIPPTYAFRCHYVVIGSGTDKKTITRDMDVMNMYMRNGKTMARIITTRYETTHSPTNTLLLDYYAETNDVDADKIYEFIEVRENTDIDVKPPTGDCDILFHFLDVHSLYLNLLKEMMGNDVSKHVAIFYFNHNIQRLWNYGFNACQVNSLIDISAFNLSINHGSNTIRASIGITCHSDRETISFYEQLLSDTKDLTENDRNNILQAINNKISSM